MKISAVVITKNEELNIKDCLETLRWADEIVIIDSHSTDKTEEFSRTYTQKIFHLDTDIVSDKRMLSLEKSSNDWILFLDADERLTGELQQELKQFEPSPDTYGYRINRRNYYFGQWIKHSGVYPDRHIRLFNKQHSAITPRLIHEGVEVKGKVGDLKGEMIHYSFRDMTQMISKINFYSSLESREKLASGRKISKIGVFTHALSAFLRVYVSRGGFRDGSGGFFISMCYSIDNFFTLLKLLKLQNKI